MIFSEAWPSQRRHLALKVKSMGYAVEAFLPRGITISPAAAKAWTYQAVEDLMRRCIGAVFVGMPRWIFKVPEAEWRLATRQIGGGHRCTLRDLLFARGSGFLGPP